MAKSRGVTLEQLYEMVEGVKAKMPNGELIDIKNNIEELRCFYLDMKKDLSDIKLKLLDPESGIVVKNNQNRERVLLVQNEVDTIQSTVTEMDDDVRELKSFKKTVNAALYVIYAATIGLVVNAVGNLFR